LHVSKQVTRHHPWNFGLTHRPPLSDEQAAELARIGSRMLARKVPTESDVEVVGVPLRPEWLATTT